MNNGERKETIDKRLMEVTHYFFESVEELDNDNTNNSVSDYKNPFQLKTPDEMAGLFYTMYPNIQCIKDLFDNFNNKYKHKINHQPPAKEETVPAQTNNEPQPVIDSVYTQTHNSLLAIINKIDKGEEIEIDNSDPLNFVIRRRSKINEIIFPKTESKQ